MATFVMTGRYSPGSIQQISAERTNKAKEIIQKYGGQLLSGYATLGEKDILLILSFPGPEDAMKASIALTNLTGIGFSTSPAVSIEEFDKLASEL
ncbi:MAG TPA: GYD domain-containing protein [Planctomycetaceae bacterium]|nr:GYD domain-containing protein [Planctomycetaceae bacterium]HIQ20048.1 GYD domain-containing protein [Planctomycetota bacterium]